MLAECEPLASGSPYRSDDDEEQPPGRRQRGERSAGPRRAWLLVSGIGAVGLAAAGISCWASTHGPTRTAGADDVLRAVSDSGMASTSSPRPQEVARQRVVLTANGERTVPVLDSEDESGSLADSKAKADAGADADAPALEADSHFYAAADDVEVRAEANRHGHNLTGMLKLPPKKKKEEKKPAWMTRRGSFIVIGDWGFDQHNHYQNQKPQCVHHIAKKMSETMALLGDVKFVINVGDSFYPSGVSGKDDPQWESKWRQVFDNRTRSVPWYSVYGNHDYQHDQCACSEKLEHCAQVNNDTNNLNFFQMPSWTYWMPKPELDLEIVGMDMNFFMNGFVPGITKKELGFADCAHTYCPSECYYISEIRSKVSVDIFNDRLENSPAKNLLVFSHYPTDYFKPLPSFLNSLRNNSKHDIYYFGGHRHNVDQVTTVSIEPNVNWLVGGGGGYSCDGEQQGFVVGEINEDYSITTYSVLIPFEVCCVPWAGYKPSTTPSPPNTTAAAAKDTSAAPKQTVV